MSKLRVVATPPSTWSRLVSDYLQEKRAAGVSPRTVKHYQAVLERVLLPFCAELGISGPSALTSRHLNQLSAGHLDGTGARSGRAISKARSTATCGRSTPS